MASTVRPTAPGAGVSPVAGLLDHARSRVRPPTRTRTRFSLEKLRQLDTYGRATTRLRQILVVLLYMLPSTVAPLIACFVPLTDPSRGIAANPTFWGHFGITFAFSYFGGMLQSRAAAAIRHDEYTLQDVVLVAVTSTALFLGVSFATATYWRFPIPFFWATMNAPWLVCLIAGNVIVLGRRFATVRGRLLAYLPSFILQIAQLVIYPAFSAAFEAGSAYVRVVLIVVFPILKALLKKSLYVLTRRTNRALSSEIAVSGVEICASMYQSMIMQSTPSLTATALVIGIDVVHGLYVVREFLVDGPHRTRMDIASIAASLLDSAPAHVGHEASKARIWPVHSPARIDVPPTTRPGRRKSLVDRTNSRNLDEEAALWHALELLQAAETILLVEYIEVAVPFVNAIYVAFATQFESAMDNPKLRPLYVQPAELHAAPANLVLYTTLQAGTLVAMAVALQYRLKLSALTMLAFVLETHVWSLQGKLIAWLSVLFVFSVLHYGVDFTFQFDFTVPPLS